ncbi:hypothetical protein LAZ67_3003857 [Cordylochernes scorpioides]|uniref:RNA-directed DNA polymerase n=1 Tax=Cordylochernes scorpioides TaxID=51811 RepID=A0ABY6K944_9ARAC|nr:hypothetical protein LAZ67_3003857 [Cordylochernes scorpioides]
MQNYINISPMEKLSDNNYLIWANRIESELRGLKLGRRIIEGEEVEKPIETDKKFDEKMKIWEDWDDDNAIARNVMNRTMNDTQILKYSSERNAKRLWNIIREEMASKNEDLQIKNRIELSKLRMKEDETVDDYLNRAMIIKSKSIQAGDEETEEKLKHRKEEKRQTEIASKAREGWTEIRNPNIKCYKCGMMGHISKECRNRMKCFKCGGFGHESTICRKYRNECHARYNFNGPKRGINRQNNSEYTSHVMETSEANYEEEYQKEEKIKWNMDSGASSHMVIDKKGDVLYEARIFGDKFEVEGFLNMEIARKAEVDDMLRHQRLAHVNFQKLKEMYDNSTVLGLKNLHNNKVNCESCTLGKIHRKSYKSIQYKQSEDILDLWHTDIVGPLDESFGYRYFITIVDDYSNFTFVIPIANESQTADSIINLIIQEERQTGRKVKRIRNDNGGEYISNYLRRWLSSKGIKQEFTTAYTPESNGKAERFNRTIVELARTMLIDSKLPLKFWSESVKVAVHINNRIKIKEMNTTPFEIYKGWKPNIVYLKRFGSEAYVHIRKEKRKKMEPKAHKGIMMGYSMIRKGYRIYLPEMDEIHEVSDVKFNEAKLGYYLMNNRGRNLDENELFFFSREDQNLISHRNEDSGDNREDRVENFNIDDEHITQDDNDVDLSEIEEIPPDEIITPRRRGPEPGMTREMREERDLRLRETEEEELIKRGVRRSESLRLIKNKENVSDRAAEIKRPKDYQEALNSDDRKQWIKAMEDEEIEVLHIPSEEMKADHLTKSVDAVKIKNGLSVPSHPMLSPISSRGQSHLIPWSVPSHPLLSPISSRAQSHLIPLSVPSHPVLSPISSHAQSHLIPCPISSRSQSHFIPCSVPSHPMLSPISSRGQSHLIPCPISSRDHSHLIPCSIPSHPVVSPISSRGQSHLIPWSVPSHPLLSPISSRAQSHLIPLSVPFHPVLSPISSHAQSHLIPCPISSRAQSHLNPWSVPSHPWSVPSHPVVSPISSRAKPHPIPCSALSHPVLSPISSRCQSHLIPCSVPAHPLLSPISSRAQSHLIPCSVPSHPVLSPISSRAQSHLIPCSVPSHPVIIPISSRDHSHLIPCSVPSHPAVSPISSRSQSHLIPLSVPSHPVSHLIPCSVPSHPMLSPISTCGQSHLIPCPISSRCQSHLIPCSVPSHPLLSPISSRAQSHLIPCSVPSHPVIIPISSRAQSHLIPLSVPSHPVVSPISSRCHFHLIPCPIPSRAQVHLIPWSVPSHPVLSPIPSRAQSHLIPCPISSRAQSHLIPCSVPSHPVIIPISSRAQSHLIPCSVPSQPVLSPISTRGPRMSKQTTLETSLDRDKEIKDLINALTKRLDNWGERLESLLSAIDDRVENINQRLQQLEESSAVTKAALSQNSKKIKDLEDQLEYLDAKSRERNLIFYGIEQDINEDCRERIRRVIEENMRTTEKINITRCHRVSRKPGAPILVEVPEQNDRTTLFKAAFNLRGTKISLSKDYSMKMREQRRVLNVKRRELVEKDKTTESICLLFAYLPPNALQEQNLTNLLRHIDYHMSEGNEVLIAGDINIRIGNAGGFHNPLKLNSPLNKYRKSKDLISSKLSEKLISFTDSNSITIANGRTKGDTHGSFTFISERGSSVLDYFMYTHGLTQIISDMWIEELSYSDHLPIVLQINTGYEAIKSSYKNEILTRKFIWTKENVEMLKHNLSDIEVGNETDINTETANFTKQIYTAMESANIIKFAKRRHQLSKPWNSNNIHDRQKYIEARREYFKLLQRKRDEFNKDKNERIKNAKDPKSFWNAIASFRKKPIIQGEIDIKEWFLFYKNLLNKENKEATFTVNQMIGWKNPDLDAEITLEEIHDVVKKLANGKAVGLDGIPNELLKNLPIPTLNKLKNLFNKIMSTEKYPQLWTNSIVHPIYKSGDKNNPTNYRGIALCSNISKLFTTILRNRLNNWIEKRVIILENQAGFRKNRSCTDHIILLNSLIQLSLRRKRGKLYVFFVDLTKAFDTVPHDLLWQKLHKMGISNKFVMLIKNFYQEAKITIRWKGQYSNNVKINSGVLQGESLSPLLFILYMADLIELYNNSALTGFHLPDFGVLHLLMYADDIAIIGESIINLQIKINLLKSYLDKNKLVLNENKSKIIVFRNGGRPARHENWYWGDTPLTVASNITYLGYPFTSTINSKKVALFYKAKANTAINATIRLIKKEKINSLKVALNLFDSVIKSILLYAAPVWAWDNTDIIDQLQNTFIKNFLNLPRYIPGYIVRLETGRISLTFTTIKLILKYFIRLQKMEDNRLPKLCWNSLKEISLMTKKPIGFCKNIMDIINHYGLTWLNYRLNYDDIQIELPNILKIKIEQLLQQDLAKLSLTKTYSNYRLLYDSFIPENYFSCNLSSALVSFIAQIRLMSTMIKENHIYAIKKEDLYCGLCGSQITDEIYHFIAECGDLEGERKKILKSLPRPHLNSIKLIKTVSDKKTDEALEFFADEILTNAHIKKWETVKDKLNARFKPYTYSPIVLASSRKLLACETVETYFNEKMDLLNQTSLKREEKIQLLTDGLHLSWRDVFAAAQPADPTKWIQVALSVEHNRQQSKLRNLFKPKVCTLSQQESSASNCPFFCPICMKKRIKVEHWLNGCPDYDPNYKTERSSKNTQPKQFIAAVTESTTSNETNKVACLSTNNPPYKLIDFKICVNKHPLQAFMDTGATISLISQNLIKSLNLHPLIDSPMQIQQANSLTKTLGYVHVNLQIQNKTRKVKLHVIPNLKFQLLIGLDIAEDFELIVDTKDKTVYTKQSAEMALVCTTFDHLQKPNQDELNKLLQQNVQIFSQHQTDIGRISIQHNIVTKEHLPINYRELNKITIDDKQPLPLLQDIFDRLHGAKYFTTLDVAWGYWHVQMHPESVPKTAFVTNDGHYEFLVMPFGLKNAASTFQKIIQQVIGTLLWKGLQQHQRQADLSFIEDPQDHQNTVMVKKRGLIRAVVPASFKEHILKEYHDNMSHPSMNKTVKLIVPLYCWSDMVQEIKSYVRSCKTCQLTKSPNQPTLGQLIIPDTELPPAQVISADTIVMGTSAEKTKHKYIQVFIDHLTRYVWAFPTIKNTAQATLQCFNRILQVSLPIKHIITENGKNFNSKEFKRCLKVHNIKQTFTTPYHPQSKGMCEKVNGTIMTKLRAALLDKPKVKWSTLLPKVITDYNNTPHDVTGFPPSFILFGYNVQPQFADNPSTSVEDARKLAIKRTQHHRDISKRRHDSRHPDIEFKVGDLVLKRIPYNDPRLIKTAPKYEGPFQVLRRLSKVTYELSTTDQDNPPRNPTGDPIKAHISQLKTFILRE